MDGFMSVGKTCELQQVAEKVAGGVSGVRGVTILPRIAGESPAIPHRPVQPRIGAVVYGKDGGVGIVTQVVIQPSNRLVTHIVVRFNELRDGNLVARETVIQLEACNLVKTESIFLTRNRPSLNAYQALDPDDYPLAPFTWIAPYPYTAGEVRWTLREIREAESQPASRLEIKLGAEVEQVSNRVMAQAGA